MPEKQSWLAKRMEPIIRDWGYAPIRETSQAYPDLAETLRWEVTPPKTLDYLQTYERAIWTYAAIYRICTSASKVPFRVYKKRITKQGQREEITDSNNPNLKLLNQVLARPNPYMTRFDLWEATVAYLELAGNTYWELVAEGDKPPEEIYVLRPDRMTVKPEAKELVASYVFNVNGRKIIFQPEDILHFKYFSPTSDLYGTSANAAAEKSIILDLYALAFNARFFKSGARLMGVLETDRHLSEKTYQRLDRKWRERYGGSEKAFRTAILEEGLKYREIASKHTDMEFIQQRKMTREEVLAAYGVHPANVGLFEFSNYANAEAQKKLFWEDTMVPKLIKLQETVTTFFLPRFGPRLVGEFDLSVIQALQESEETKSKTACSLTDSGIMTRNEARKQFYNLPGTPGGDKITIRGKYITVVEGTEEAEPAELTQEDLRDIKAALRRQRKKS
ncbi:hypothetical protein ES703_58528 [subsurface metagenome]